MEIVTGINTLYNEDVEMNIIELKSVVGVMSDVGNIAPKIGLLGE